MMERTQSFFLKEPNSNDKIRIFCFPYAGGGASAYRNWGTYLPNYVGVYPIQIPGRENRITEKALTDMCKLTDKIVSAIHPYLDTPYLVFGHSLLADCSGFNRRYFCKRSCGIQLCSFIWYSQYYFRSWYEHFGRDSRYRRLRAVKCILLDDFLSALYTMCSSNGNNQERSKKLEVDVFFSSISACCCSVEDDMVMNMIFINMGADHVFIFSFQDFVCKLLP